jgi:CheY-like chemotaxis protein
MIFDPKFTHLIFTDLQMPEINGVKWAQLISQNINKNAYIYCITGDSQKINELKSSNLFTNIYSKPVKMDLMEEVLSQHCQLAPVVLSNNKNSEKLINQQLQKLQKPVVSTKSIAIGAHHQHHFNSNYFFSQESIKSKKLYKNQPTNSNSIYESSERPEYSSCCLENTSISVSCGIKLCQIF